MEAPAPLGLVPVANGQTGEVAGGDGTILDVKDGQSGVRDLRAAVAQLALRTRDASARRAVLLIRGARMSAEGVREEWTRLLTVLAPDVADRLRLVAVLEHDVAWAPRWLFALQACFPTRWPELAASVGAGLRAILDDAAFEEARHCCNVGLLANMGVTETQLRAIARQVIADAIEPVEGAAIAGVRYGRSTPGAS